jgi:hypothetical protein
LVVVTCNKPTPAWACSLHSIPTFLVDFIHLF